MSDKPFDVNGHTGPIMMWCETCEVHFMTPTEEHGRCDTSFSCESYTEGNVKITCGGVGKECQVGVKR